MSTAVGTIDGTTLIKYFKKQFFQDAEIVRLQEDIADTFNSVLKNPLLDYVILRDVALSTTQVEVAHLLQREPLGWIIIGKNANVDVWEISRNSSFLTLDASGTVTVDLYVF